MTSQSAPRRGHRARKIILIGLTLGVVAVFSAIGLLLWANAQIDRIPGDEITSLDEVEGPRNILVVGTDNREGLPADFKDTFGRFGGSRTDVIMLVHFIPGERAQILSLPRDLKVNIPGHGTNRINAAAALGNQNGDGGGRDLLISTVKFNLGVEINNYVEIDFAGFAAIVDALGGVELDFPYPARDAKSGLEVNAGRQVLNGEQALAYARSRQYEELRDGKWTKKGANDIARTERQQQLVLALFDQATSLGSALSLPGFATTVADQITADESLTLGVLVELGRAVLRLNSGDLEAMTLPVKISNEDGRSYVVWVDSTQAVLDAFKAGLPFPT